MKIILNSKIILSLIFSACFSLMSTASAADAVLPYAEDVPMSEAMAIDGVWKNVVLNKNFRFEGGRAITVDPWLAYIFWKVEPGMITMQDITQPTIGNYIGYNLVDKQSFEATLKPNGILKYKSAIFSSDFIPVQLDNPEMMAAELANLGGGNYTQTESQPEPEYAPEPEPEYTPEQAPVKSECVTWAINPETNAPVCMD